jgi:hypothetical protein
MADRRGAIEVQRAGFVNAAGAHLYHTDALGIYDQWPAPTCIVVDGPYGLGKYPGEPKTPRELPQWYAPHAVAWYRHAAPNCTLWFWGSELSWATVHQVLDESGWQYEEACVWDKGIAHVAGNCNSRTIRSVPVVSELAVRYTKRNRLATADGSRLPLKDWLRTEWLRSGLPMRLANEACGVRNAATRKYLTQCHLWYFPPADAMQLMADYCVRHGTATEWPYFSLDGICPFDSGQWAHLRSKWHHTHGITNIWSELPVHGEERVRGANGYVHANQKPLRLMAFQIASCTDAGDAVWEPFGGLCSASLAAVQLGRRAYAAETCSEYFEAAAKRLRNEAPSIFQMAA